MYHVLNGIAIPIDEMATAAGAIVRNSPADIFVRGVAELLNQNSMEMFIELAHKVATKY